MTTTDLNDGSTDYDAFAAGPPPPAPPPAVAERGEAIVVTGSRSMKAELEALGDVKLYRIPEPVTVAANSQKQVALIEQPGVQVEVAYRQRIPAGQEFESPATRTIVTRNRTAEGLGVPLPAGGLVLFANRNGRPLLIGEGSISDAAIGEDVEIEVGDAPGVRSVQRLIERKGTKRVELRVTNDSAAPVRYEAELMAASANLKADRKLGKRDGRPLWTVTVPANGSATLRYRVKD